MVSCHAMLVKRRGIPCRCAGKHLNEKDGHYYCSRHFEKVKNKEFQPIGQDCPVCLKEMNKYGNITAKCGHLFHTNCYFKLKNKNVNNCPVCEQCILYESQDDPIARDFKSDSERYAGFKLWCIQKTIGTKLITCPERNTEYCTLAQLSLSLNRELKKIQAEKPDKLFDQLMTLWRDFPNVLKK